MAEINLTNRRNMVGMDMDAPYGVYHNGNQVGVYDNASDASRHLRQLRRSLMTPLQIRMERDQNRTNRQAPLSATKCCVFYLKKKKEFRTAWFYRVENAELALKVMKKKYGEKNAIIYRD